MDYLYSLYIGQLDQLVSQVIENNLISSSENYYKVILKVLNNRKRSDYLKVKFIDGYSKIQ
jgi:hypothetical protein